MRKCDIPYSKNQINAIEQRNSNLLIAAAAGSGKTMVLVEHIIDRITASENKTDIDKLLVVTFTRMAAKEMRDRIEKTLNKMIEENPEDENLRRQIKLLPQANISTIDKFCGYIVHNYFFKTEFEPAYNLVEAKDINALKEDTLDEMIEELLESGDKRIKRLIKSFGSARKNANLKNAILNIDQQLESYPWPEKWLENQIKVLSSDIPFTDTSLYKEYVEKLINAFQAFINKEIKTIAGLYDLFDTTVALENMQQKLGYEDIANKAGIPFSALSDETLKELDAISKKLGIVINEDNLGLVVCQYEKDLINQKIARCEKKKKKYYEFYTKAKADVNSISSWLADDFFTLKRPATCWKRGNSLYPKKDDYEKGTEIGIRYKKLIEGALSEHEKVSAEVKSIHSFFKLDRNVLNQMTKASNDEMVALLEVVLKFRNNVAVAKKEDNKYDFSDIEHAALDILINPENFECTEVAKELRTKFDEIIIDEYQDSNDLQEYILKSISREEEGHPNMFMVGDLKQSIYAFRNAKPALFIGKYKSFERLNDSNAEEFEALKHCEQAYAAKSYLIELSQNFRSRYSVLESINEIFRSIMKNEYCGFNYDKEAELNFAFKDLDNDKPCNKSEYIRLLFDKNKNADSAEEAASVADLLNDDSDDENPFPQKKSDDEAIETEGEVEAEAGYVTKRIKDIITGVENIPVWDKEIKMMRPAKASDIAILLREGKTSGRIYKEKLEKLGIGVKFSVEQSYYESDVVNVITSMLNILDNPRDDVPAATVAYSPIIGLNSEELSFIKAVYGDHVEVEDDDEDGERNKKVADKKWTAKEYLFDSFIKLVNSDIDSSIEAVRDNLEKKGVDLKEGSEDRLTIAKGLSNAKAKLEKFFAIYNEIEKNKNKWSVHELISEIYERTGYYNLVGTLPSGEAKQSNLNTLVLIAKKNEAQQRYSLYDFIVEVKRQKELNVPVEEAGDEFSDSDDVRIYTIHKSKGLEFPIVFLCGMGKGFNTGDLKEEILINPKEQDVNDLASEYGIAGNYHENKRRLKFKTYARVMFAERKRKDMINEELRVLYVALTRAKEKLIVTTTKDVNKHEVPYKLSNEMLDRIEKDRSTSLQLKKLFEEFKEYEMLVRYSDAKSLRDLFEMALSLNQDANSSWEVINKEIEFESKKRDFSSDDLAYERFFERLEKFKSKDYEDYRVKELIGNLEKVNGYEYHYKALANTPFKLSVTKIKELASEVKELYREGEADNNSYRNEISVDKLPKSFGLTAAEKGTLYHKIYELLNFSDIFKSSFDFLEIKRQIKAMADSRLIDSKELKALDDKKINGLFETELGKRMAKADAAHLLYKEHPFVLGIPKKELFSEIETEDEILLVQGIIDAYFIEDEKVILLDYKTDKVNDGSEETLVKKYKKQLELYSRALRLYYGKEVSEIWIYSTTLGKAVEVK
ncbi:MAG: UvrD-helicase domain-containing protein [Lachnospiraceae bacterium]|nr:UvrD-helicase domain-containing protein [Lachnospiraceae bacterium]